MRSMEKDGYVELRIKRETEYREATFIAYTKLELWSDFLRIKTELVNHNVENVNSISYVAYDNASHSRRKYFNCPEIIAVNNFC